MEKPSFSSATQNTTNTGRCTAADVRLSERTAKDSRTDCGSDTPRTVIRGESIKNKKKNNKEKNKNIKNNQSYAALTDWLNVSFPFYPEINDPLEFFNSFSEVTHGNFGGMTDQQRGLHGWEQSFRFDRGGVMFAFGGQRNTAFLSMPGESCSYITEWLTFVSFLRDNLQARITRWDGAVDDFKGIHSIDYAVDIYKQGSFKQGGRNPNPRQHGNWITQDDLGRTFEVGNRKNGKLIRIYEKGKQLGDPSSPWVRWEVELHAKDRIIPWDVLLHPGEYVAGAYPCMSWVSEQASRIHTIKEQDRIIYERLKQVASTAYGALFNVMLEREGSAEKVVDLLKRQAIPKRLAFTDHYLRTHGGSDEP